MTIADQTSALAIVIGAGGMGMAIAQRLGENHALLLADKDAPGLSAKVEHLVEAGFDAHGIVCDVTDQVSVDALAHEARRKGGCSTLVHVAGLSPSMGDGAAILSVNLQGPARVSRSLLAEMKPGGSAIFIGSTAGHGMSVADEMRALLRDPLAECWTERMIAALGENATPQECYRLSKLGLMMLCRSQAEIWGQGRVRIVSLSPGLIDTPMGRKESVGQPGRNALIAQIPLQREGEIREIVDVVEFLASQRASFISGTDILVDGGISAALER